MEELEDVPVALLNLLSAMVNYSKSPLKKLILIPQEPLEVLEVVTMFPVTITQQSLDLWDIELYPSTIRTILIQLWQIMDQFQSLLMPVLGQLMNQEFSLDVLMMEILQLTTLFNS